LLPYNVESLFGAAYLAIGQPERAVEWWRAQLAHGRDTHTFTRASLVLALTVAGSPEEAMAAATGLIDAAEATHHPCALSYTLFAYGFAYRDTDPSRALDAVRRGLVIAQDKTAVTAETARVPRGPVSAGLADASWRVTSSR
jgi:hypothetical protein